MATIGIGIPTTIVGVQGDLLLDWARRADELAFSSLSLIDRVAYANYEVMATLGALAGVTKAIRLMPAVLLGPTRPTGLLAKQAATVDALSNGRLALGLGLGARPDDYAATGATFEARGRQLDRQIEDMRRVWAGGPLSEGVGPIGPAPVQPGGPELLIGAFAPAALARVGRWGAGYIGVRAPAEMAASYRLAEDGWRAAGRPGRPRFVAFATFGLGPDAAERGAANLRAYYAYWPEGRDRVVAANLTTPEAIRDHIRACEAIGVDEVCLNPTIASLDQVDRLREVVG